MIENRPIVAMAIGYIIGIIMGLYCKISIVFLYLIIFFIYSILKKPKNKKFKLISFSRYFRYVKIVITKKVFITILLASVLSNSIMLYKNNQYENIVNHLEGNKIQVQGIVLSDARDKKYKEMYKIKITEIRVNIGVESNKNVKELKSKKLYLNIRKSLNTNLQYGDKISIVGTYIKPQARTNYRGFDYKQYLKTLGIYGTIEVENVSKIESMSLQNILKRFNDLSCNIKRLLQENFEEKTSNVLLGILFGDTYYIDEDIKEDFLNSNISHILAVSGMHVGIILFFCKFVFEKSVGKRVSNILSIIILIFYMMLTGLPPSVIRATIMACLVIFSKTLYRKSDVWINISLSLLILLIYNPFLITSTSLILSYAGTIGIIVYSKIFIIKSKVIKTIGMTIAVSIFISPVTAVCFNHIPIFSLCISMIIGIIVAPIIILGFNFIIFSEILGLFHILKLDNFKIANTFMVFFQNVLEFLKSILSINTKILLKLANFGSNIPLNKFYITTPNIIRILIYYTVVFVIMFVFLIYKPKRNHNKNFNQRIRNLISLLKYRYNQNKNKVISIIIVIVFAFSIIKITPKKLKIYFIDVGQGDSCLIVTPLNKKILIDGGGSEKRNYDVGKNVLLPYLFDRGIKSLDYIIISHFDTDHVGGLLYVMENMKVKNVIISKQFEKTDNLEKFYRIVKEKNINVQIVDAEDKLQVEKSLFFCILWPESSNMISENAINNNSIVCKLVYKNFSMLFTGDIEEVAEKLITQKYKNTVILNSTILKVAHHGSKSSSIQEFLELVKPKIAVIGVGKNNNYGHPGSEVIGRLENIRHKNL